MYVPSSQIYSIVYVVALTVTQLQIYRWRLEDVRGGNQQVDTGQVGYSSASSTLIHYYHLRTGLLGVVTNQGTHPSHVSSVCISVFF